MNRVGLSGTGDGKASGGGERRDEKSLKSPQDRRVGVITLTNFRGE